MHVSSCYLATVALEICREIPRFRETDDRGRPNFGFGFGFGAECGQMGTFGGHSVLTESSRTTFGALSVSACCSW